MTKERMRIKIAELLRIPLEVEKWGFRYHLPRVGPPITSRGFHSEAEAVEESKFLTSEDFICSTPEPYMSKVDLPNYPECLNACHEMEGGHPWGNATQWEMYNYALANIAEGRKWDDYCHWSDIGTSTTSASAIQRCEAFLRTLGQWEEDEESPSQ